MKLSEAVIPISYAKAHTSRVIARIIQDRKPVVITQNGQARVIIQDLHSYEQTQDSLALLKILAQGQADIRNKRFKPLQESFVAVRRQARTARAS